MIILFIGLRSELMHIHIFVIVYGKTTSRKTFDERAREEDASSIGTRQMEGGCGGSLRETSGVERESVGVDVQ